MATSVRSGSATQSDYPHSQRWASLQPRCAQAAIHRSVAL